MSLAVFPSLVGQALEITRTPVFDTTVQTNRSGKTLVVSNQTYPVYQWDVAFNVLRQGAIPGGSYAELAQLMGFFNARRGRFDSFLYPDPDDNAVTGQAVAAGDGATAAFQLVRAFGGFVDPVLAPNAVSAVYVNGTPRDRLGGRRLGHPHPRRRHPRLGPGGGRHGLRRLHVLLAVPVHRRQIPADAHDGRALQC